MTSVIRWAPPSLRCTACGREFYGTRLPWHMAPCGKLCAGSPDLPYGTPHTVTEFADRHINNATCEEPICRRRTSR